jgi:hypothetical protein|tara:strand:- start:421 stop:573 length:153 start_codon:yes stop_codon:yes gene_type:complete
LNRYLKERTTWDGIVLVITCGAFLILGDLAEIAAYAGIVYGIWTILMEEE